MWQFIRNVWWWYPAVADLEFRKGWLHNRLKRARSGPARTPHLSGKSLDFWLSEIVSFLVYCWGEIAKVGRPIAKPSCCVWSPQNSWRDPASGSRGCKAAGYPRKVRENKRSHIDSISPFLAAREQCINSLACYVHCLYGYQVLLVAKTCTRSPCARYILDTGNYWVDTRALLLRCTALLPLCQFPLCQFPFGQLSTLSIPILYVCA